MSVIYPWKNGYWTKVGNTLVPSSLVESGAIASPTTPSAGGTDVSYSANASGGTQTSGTTGTGPVTLPGNVNIGGNADAGNGSDVSYGSNSGSGGDTGSGTTITTGTETGGDDGSGTVTPSSTDVSYGANGENTGSGTSTGAGENGTTSEKPTLSPEMAAYDMDGDGVLTYKDFEVYKKNVSYEAAAEARKNAERAADREHERAVVDAQVAGEQNKASYGAQAERLASMGMSGGGYSDYLNAQAYAQSRGEIQAAGAERAAAFRMAEEKESDARLNADLTYAGNMQAHDEKEREKQEEKDKQDLAKAEAAILSAITAGTYKTKDEAIAAAKAKGITDENVLSNIESQWTIWDNGQKNSETAVGAFYNNIANGDYATVQEAKDAAAALGITDPAVLENIDNKWTVWAVSSFKAAIQRGDYTTKEAVLEAAKLAGISSASVLSEIGDAWTAWDNGEKDKVQTDAFNVIVSDIGNGVYTTVESALQAAADKGITDESVLQQIKNEWTTWNTEKMKATVDLKEYITAGMSDNELQTYADLYGVDVENLKQMRADAAETEIYQYLNGGDVATAQSIVEAYYKNRAISKETYQAFYYDASIMNCDSATTVAEVLQIEADLNNLKNAGKLSSKDYNNAINYLYQKFGQVLAPNSYSTASDKNIFGVELPKSQKMVVTIGGVKYDISTDISGSYGNFVDSDISKVLSNMVGGSPTNGVLAAIGDTIYVYRTGLGNGDGWVKVKPYSWGTINGTSKDFYDVYKKEFGYQAAPSAPESGSIPQGPWKSYEDAAAAGFGNIMTRNEWNSRKASTGCNTYQEYLNKMYAKYVG